LRSASSLHLRRQGVMKTESSRQEEIDHHSGRGRFSAASLGRYCYLAAELASKSTSSGVSPDALGRLRGSVSELLAAQPSLSRPQPQEIFIEIDVYHERNFHGRPLRRRVLLADSNHPTREAFG
jgi:hypothetical protein